jgi:hypothetical protein
VTTPDDLEALAIPAASGARSRLDDARRAIADGDGADEAERRNLLSDVRQRTR